jgi:hypothetical protein
MDAWRRSTRRTTGAALAAMAKDSVARSALRDLTNDEAGGAALPGGAGCAPVKAAPPRCGAGGAGGAAGGVKRPAEAAVVADDAHKRQAVVPPPGTRARARAPPRAGARGACACARR